MHYTTFVIRQVDSHIFGRGGGGKHLSGSQRTNFGASAYASLPLPLCKLSSSSTYLSKKYRIFANYLSTIIFIEQKIAETNNKK